MNYAEFTGNHFKTYKDFINKCPEKFSKNFNDNALRFTLRTCYNEYASPYKETHGTDNWNRNSDLIILSYIWKHSLFTSDIVSEFVFLRIFCSLIWNPNQCDGVKNELRNFYKSHHLTFEKEISAIFNNSNDTTMHIELLNELKHRLSDDFKKYIPDSVC